MPSTLPEGKQYELEKRAEKHTIDLYLWAFICGPIAYAKLGEWGLATFCLLTGNWFLLGFFYVPAHVYDMVTEAQNELARAGIEGYEGKERSKAFLDIGDLMKGK